MAKFHDDEFLRSSAAGQFRPHSLITRIFPDGDISLSDDAQPLIFLHARQLRELGVPDSVKLS